MGSISTPLFPNEKRLPMSVSKLDVHFHSVLLEVQHRFPNAILGNVNLFDDYSVFWSLWRGTTTEAQNVGIAANEIESNNRCRKNHRAKGIQPALTMMQHYTDTNVTLPLLTQFSRALPS